jgi:valyl-tRNA synthetase
MRQPYPQPDTVNLDEDAISEMEWVKEFIVGIRQIRSGMNIKPSKPLPVLLQDASDYDRKLSATHSTIISTLARLDSIDFVGDDAPESATALVGEMKVLIPMAGLIDKEAEVARLSKEIDNKKQEVKRIEGKLSNPNFVERAPEAVVEKERAKIADIQTALKSFEDQLIRIKKM